jgi:Fe-S-cluster-containing dehydrogenase component
MDALEMNDDGVVEINLARCIGCGLCVTACPEEALRLVLKPEAERRTPPATTLEQMMYMARKRGIEV